MAETKKNINKNSGGPGHGGMMPGEKAKNFGVTIKRLLNYVAYYKVKLLLVVVFAILGAIFNIVGPAILGNATDVIVKGISSGGIDFSKLLNYIYLLGGLYIVAWFFYFYQGVIMAKVSQNIIFRMRDEMSAKMDRLPLKYFDTKTHGDVQSYFINDIETINQSLSQSITQTISNAVTIIGILFMMIKINLAMTTVALLVLPLSLSVIRIVVSKSQGHFKKQQSLLGDINSNVEEMFTGHTIIKSFNREDAAYEEFDEINENWREAAWKSQFLSGLMMPLTQFVGNIGYVIVCLLGGVFAIKGTVSIGNIQSFLQYVRNLNQPLSIVANVVNMLQSTAVAAERIFAFLDEPEEKDAFNGGKELMEKTISPLENPGKVTFDNVSFGYQEGEPVITNFSYEAKPGAKVAIVGPTGSGKTTLVKLLLRYYELNRGHIYVDDVDITKYTRKDLRDMFGMVLQDTWLFSGTIGDNIAYGTKNATKENIIKAAKAANIHKFISCQPDGYDTLISEDASNISQGQKQLLTIARAMLANNPILILDEATSSVDTRTEQQIQSAMANLMKGKTSFVIAHRLSTIKDADHILVINHGNIIEQGTHDELLAKGGFYKNIYQSQFEHQ